MTLRYVLNDIESVLIVAPHADDEVIGAGGLISFMKDRGKKVNVAVVMTGNTAFRHMEGRVVTKAERVEELHEASKVLGVNETSVLFPGYELSGDVISIRKIVNEIDNLIEKYNVDAIFFPQPGFHQDHEIVYKACYASLRPSSDKRYPQLAALYEYPASCWGPTNFDGGLMYVDITFHIDKKIEALRCYKSQLRSEFHLFSPETIRIMAQLRGREAGVEYAEAFRVLRFIAIDKRRE